MSLFIIAEGGVNHNGDISLAHRLIDVAVAAGADAIKFQTFVPENLVTPDTPQAAYQTRNMGQRQSQLAMLKQLALPQAAFVELKQHCDEAGIAFMSTPFDEHSVAFLAELGVRRFKIPSGELLSTPYLRTIARYNRPTILSSGMATLDEVRFGVETLLQAGLGRENLTVLHCTSAYPAPADAVNLQAMVTLAETFRLPVGLSDHTEDMTAAIMAVALGAKVIEKHFTLDRNLPGPDHAASLDPEALKAFVAALRRAQTMLGDGIKQPAAAEQDTRAVARRRIVAARPIDKGQRIGAEDITLRRAPAGWFGDEWDRVIGAVAPRDFAVGEGIVW
jgi:N-acetylneuraminate synthase/N,N'-diacetyllegionaminate synthase